MSQTTLATQSQNMVPRQPLSTAMNMDTVGGFESMQRAAKLFSSSTIVPTAYRGEAGRSNCFIAIDMAIRMQANPLMVMQNLYIVHGNPAWSAQFLIATFNKCGRFSALRYEFTGQEGEDNWGCRAVATELATKEKLTGPLITIGMAKKSGWYSKKDKNGLETSKWQSMPEQMLRYRAAAWFIRVYAPEIAMGLQTAEEMNDATISMELGKDGAYEMTLSDLETMKEIIPVQESETSGATEEASVEAKDNIKGTTRKKVDKTTSKVLIEQTPEQSPAPAEEYIPPIQDKHECPKPLPDGSPRYVTSWDCDECADKNGCPERIK